MAHIGWGLVQGGIEGDPFPVYPDFGPGVVSEYRRLAGESAGLDQAGNDAGGQASGSGQSSQQYRVFGAVAPTID